MLTWAIMLAGWAAILVGSSTVFRLLGQRARRRQPDGSLDEPPWVESLLRTHVIVVLAGIGLVAWGFLR